MVKMKSDSLERTVDRAANKKDRKPTGAKTSKEKKKTGLGMTPVRHRKSMSKTNKLADGEQ